MAAVVATGLSNQWGPPAEQGGMMKHLVYLAIAAGALAVMGCGGAAPPKPADPPAPTAAKYSCGDGYVFDSDQVPGPEGAVVNDVFYWGSSTSGAARCYSATRNNSMVGRVESNAGDATGATVMSVTLSDELRWYFILEFSDGTYCSAATAGDGRATCFATVERDATGFRLDDLPAVPLPVPTGAPERPPGVPESPPGGPGPGGGDQGGGHTGAPEPEEPAEEEPTAPAPPPATSSLPCPNPLPESYWPAAGLGGDWTAGETALGCTRLRLTLREITESNLGIYPPDHSVGEPSLFPYAYRLVTNARVRSSTFSAYEWEVPKSWNSYTSVTFSISIPKEISLTSEGNTFKLSARGSLRGEWQMGGIIRRGGSGAADATIFFECSDPGQSGECVTDEQGNPLYPHEDAWRSLAGSTFTVYCRWSVTIGSRNWPEDINCR